MPFDEPVLMTFQSLRIPALTGVFLLLTEFGAETIQPAGDRKSVV